MKSPVNVAITGAAGQIGYALAFRVASGQMLGADQPINLHLLEITPALPGLPTTKVLKTDGVTIMLDDLPGAGGLTLEVLPPVVQPFR